MDGYLGEIRIFAGNFPPQNWQFCHGQTVSINLNPSLYSIIGTNFGGDGRVSFCYPDFRGRASVGAVLKPVNPADINWYIGEFDGTEQVLLSKNEMPSHTHSADFVSVETMDILSPIVGDPSTPTNDPSLAYPTTAPTGKTIYSSNSNVNMGESDFNVDVYSSDENFVVEDTGGKQSHENMQPSLALNYIICVDGEYPSRN